MSPVRVEASVTASVPPDASRSRWTALRERLGATATDGRAAVSHALGAVVVGLVVCVGLVVLGWASDPESATTWWQAVRIGVSAWLLAHLASLQLLSEVATTTSPADPLTQVSSELSLPPGGLLLAAGAVAAGVGMVLGRRTGVLAGLVLSFVVAATYAGSAWVLAWVVDTPTLAADPLEAASGAAALSLVAVLAGGVCVQAGSLLRRAPVAVANQLRRVVPAAGVALTAWLAAGALVLSVALATDIAGVSDVYAGVAPGPAGGALLLAGELLALPTLVVWAASVLAGPGVAMGGGTIDPGGSTVVDVPALPVLAALPEPGPFGVWMWGGTLLVVLAGALAGWHAHRHPSSRGATALDRIADAAAVAALVGAAAILLCLVTAGSLGPWAPLGPDPVRVGGAVTAEVFLGAVVASTSLHLLAGRPLLRWRAPRVRLPAALSRAGRRGR